MCKNNVKALLTISLLWLGTAGTAQAVPITYDFESAAFDTLYPTQGVTTNINWTLGGVSLNISAVEVINDNHGNILRLEGADALVYIDKGSYYKGLGARSYSSDSDSRLDGSGSYHTLIDGSREYIHDDGLRFVFDTEVSLNNIDFGDFYYSTNDDFNISFFDGTSYVTPVIDHDDDHVDTPYATTLDRDEFAFSNISGKEFIIWADGSSDEFLIDRITVSTADVPEPATLALLALGLAGIGASRKRR